MTKYFTLFLFFCSLTFNLQAATFTSIADGSLHDPAIWSLDGGVTPCNCTPTTDISNVTVFNKGSIEINHNIFTNLRGIVNGRGIIININPNAALTMESNLEIRNGVVNNHGLLNVNHLIVYNSGFLFSDGVINIEPGDLINEFQGRIELAGQVYVHSGNISNEGWLTIRTNAQVVAAGTITNQSYVDMEPGACINVYGTVTNNFEFNLINGPGTAYVQSGNDINNLDFWDTGVDWCANGLGSGLSHPSNCANCGTLPVELTNFDATLENGQVEITWQTASESQNSHFTLEKSADGVTFQPFMQVSSNFDKEGASYQEVDMNPYFGISWYRLSQTDMNGTTSQLETVMIQNQDEATRHFNAFPNPFTDRINITTYGLEGKNAEVRVLDISGREVTYQKLENTTDYTVYPIDPGTMIPGMYIVRISSGNVTENYKLMYQP